MSRTYKDAPYEVRKRRLGISDDDEIKDNCTLCEEKSTQKFVSGFSAIFFAHEVKQREAFIAIAEENGYNVEIFEVYGYLGQDPLRSRYTADYNRRSKFHELIKNGSYDPQRAIYNAPRGKLANLEWHSSGRYDSSHLKKRDSEYPIYSYRNARFFEEIFGDYHVSNKNNIFEVVSLTRTVLRSGGHHWHYHNRDRDPLSYLLWGHCSCSYCEPETEGEKVKLRSIESKIRNAFNSGDLEAVEEVADMLPAYGTAAKRTWYC